VIGDKPRSLWRAGMAWGSARDLLRDISIAKALPACAFVSLGVVPGRGSSYLRCVVPGGRDPSRRTG
jgi:hypothetical protein